MIETAIATSMTAAIAETRLQLSIGSPVETPLLASGHRWYKRTAAISRRINADSGSPRHHHIDFGTDHQNKTS
jgi:hypothetical protein